MDNYIAIVFDNEAQANEGLHRLWALDTEERITVHGAAVVRRNMNGFVEVATQETDPGARSAIGIGVGALLGALAKPGDGDSGACVLPRGKALVVAEVSETSPNAVDEMARADGHEVYRRNKQSIQNPGWDWDYADYLYPYEYRPSFS